MVPVGSGVAGSVLLSLLSDVVDVGELDTVKLVRESCETDKLVWEGSETVKVVMGGGETDGAGGGRISTVVVGTAGFGASTLPSSTSGGEIPSVAVGSGGIAVSLLPSSTGGGGASSSLLGTDTGEEPLSASLTELGELGSGTAGSGTMEFAAPGTGNTVSGAADSVVAASGWTGSSATAEPGSIGTGAMIADKPNGLFSDGWS